MMGAVMIDDVNARLDGLFDVPFEFYYRRMARTLDLKTATATSTHKEHKRVSSIDPLLGMATFLVFLTYSSLFHWRQILICI